MKQLECLFIGSITQDIIMRITGAPVSDQRVLADMVCTTGGGIAGNSASAFSKLGGYGGIISAVGDDETADYVRGFVASRGLGFSQLITVPGKATPFSAILVEPDGKRLISYYGGCMSELTVDKLDKKALHNTKMVHLGGLDEDFIVDVSKYIKENTDALISVDAGNRSKECIDRLLPYMDIFIPDNKTVTRTIGLPYEEACKYYYDGGAKLVCITLGDEGSLAYDGKDFTYVPPIKANVIDTTGAGDNFHGAFVYCYQQGFSIEKTLKFCNTFSGLCCEALGGSAAEPTYEETIARMELEYAIL